MFCISCGKEVPGNAAFCLHCGKPVTSGSSTTAVSAQTNGSSTQVGPARKLLRNVVGAIVLVLLLLYAYAVLTQQGRNRPGAPGSSPVSLLRPFSQKLVSDTFDVPALSWKTWTIRVDQASVSPHIVGTFQAS